MSCKHLLTPAAALVLALGSSSVLAAPILKANAMANIGGAITTNNDNTGPVATATVDDPGSFGEYSTVGTVDTIGNLAVSSQFFGASGVSATLDSRAVWEDTFEASAGDSATFSFFIPSGVIAFEANNVGGLSGVIAVDIELNGASIFTTLAEVTTLSTTPSAPADLDLVQAGTDLLTPTFGTGLAPPSFGLSGAGYTFGSLSRSLNLNPIVGTNTLTYVMRSNADGLIGETSALASIGDPLNLSTGPGVTLEVESGSVDVPAPATLALLLIGLFGARLQQRTCPH